MTYIVEAIGIVLGYGDNIAVAKSDVHIPEGAVTAIIGPNGSGKSTLLHSFAGLITPQAGQITIAGVGPADAWRHVSYVLQAINVPIGVPITVREVVGMGRFPKTGWFGRFTAADRALVADAMAQLEVADLADRHLSELSGGQRQRVYVAQGLAQGHDVLLLDEPLTGLDLVSAKTIDRIIHAEQDGGRSVIFTTHDLAEARAADHVVLMGGRVVADGPPAAVLTRENLAEAYQLGSLHEAYDVLDDPADTTTRPVLDAHGHEH
jgi:iron complex transport system ATP-binding protein